MGDHSYLDVYIDTRERHGHGRSDCQCRALVLGVLSVPRTGSDYGADPKWSGSSASHRGLNRYVYVFVFVFGVKCRLCWCGIIFIQFPIFIQHQR